MKNLICTCLLLAVCAGCSKEEPVVVTPDTADVPPATEAPVAVTPQAPRVASPSVQPAAAPQAQPQPVAGVKPLAGRVDPYMTALLKKFVAQKGRLPESILELSGASDGFPLAPAGYLYEIDPATSDVKLVKQ